MSTYLNRLKLAKETAKNLEPKIVFLDIPQGVAEVGDAIADGLPVVTDYGATYGTAFMPSIRLEVAQARLETLPLAVVSLVTFRNTAYKWMDMNMIHPALVQPIFDGKLNILEGLSFLRYPATVACAKFAGPFSINPDHEVQTFVVPDTDPLMSYLENERHLQFYAVRSSNVTGRPEETHAPGALAYAAEISSPIFAIRNLQTLEIQKKDLALHAQDILDGQSRQRIGSQPIIRLPNKNEEPVLRLVRAGNTDPDTLRKLLADVLVNGVTLEHTEEKITAFNRKLFCSSSGITNPTEIRQELLKHSNLS